MNVINVHKRTLITSPEDAWRLIANLGSPHEILWPEGWPAMRFDRPLGLGAVGGHGPIGYHVEQYSAPELIRLRFTAPRGFAGYHEFRIVSQGTSLVFRHTLRVQTRGMATWAWLLVLHPLHDALIEDLMDRASSYASGHTFFSFWPLRVKLLRWFLSRFPQLYPRVRVQEAQQRPR